MEQENKKVDSVEEYISRNELKHEDIEKMITVPFKVTAERNIKSKIFHHIVLDIHLQLKCIKNLVTSILCVICLDTQMWVSQNDALAQTNIPIKQI